tara:strand:+ start:2456 stop:4090 length:1635 start_codon:yes stop_codon:yes gene_type:complete
MLHKIKISILVVFAALFISCEDDFLETTPTDAVTPAIALGTVEDMEKVLNGVHSTLYSQLGGTITGAGNNRAGNQYWIPLGDNLAGELIHSADANNLGWRSEMQWNSHTQETSETTEILWYHRYNTILHANLLIEKISSGDLPVTPRLRAIEGQAYAYRAYALLSLVQHYAKGYLVGNPATDKGVPIILEPQTTGPRATVAEVYNQIGLDLDASIAAFANATPRGTGGARDKSQLNINVAHGLKARWALSKGDWQTAATSAVAARQGFPLMNEAAWKSGFNTNDLSEVIWGSNVIGAETTFFRAYFYLASNTFNGSQIRNNPKIADRRLIDAIPATDYRGDVFIKDAPNTNTSASNGEGGFANDPNYTDRDVYDARIAEIKSEYGLVSGHNLHPYMHFKLKQKNPGSIDPDDVIIMRSSEMYLIEAEAKAMLSDISGAQAALAPLATQRNSAFNVASFNTQASLMEEIKFQRRVELWGEGFGYTDKIRWDEEIDHEANGGSGASLTLYQSAFKQARPSVNDDWIFKIPQAEIDANPDITPDDQN